MPFLLFAQEVAKAADSSGMAGWASFGIVGVVLSWFALQYLPAQERRWDAAYKAKDEQSKALLAAKDEQLKQLLAAKDEQQKELLAAKDAQLKEQQKEFAAAVNTLVTTFKAESAAERAACDKHFSTLADSINAAFRTMGSQMQSHSERNQQWLELLRKEIESRQKAT